jgi:hypothetical protein
MPEVLTKLRPYDIVYMEGYLSDLRGMYKEICEHEEYIMGLCFPPSIPQNTPVQGGKGSNICEFYLAEQIRDKSYQFKVNRYNGTLKGIRDLCEQDPGFGQFLHLRYLSPMKHSVEEVMVKLGIGSKSKYYELRDFILQRMYPYIFGEEVEE